MSFPSGSVIMNLPASARDAGLISGSGRSPGRENGNPLQYSRLGNPMDRGAWWAKVPGVTEEMDTAEWLRERVSIQYYLSTWRSSFLLQTWLVFISEERGFFTVHGGPSALPSVFSSRAPRHWLPLTCAAAAPVSMAQGAFWSPCSWHMCWDSQGLCTSVLFSLSSLG